jgi:hypothetical protein
MNGRFDMHTLFEHQRASAHTGLGRNCIAAFSVLVVLALALLDPPCLAAAGAGGNSLREGTRSVDPTTRSLPVIGAAAPAHGRPEDVSGGWPGPQLYFEANRGQVNSRFPFVARGPDCSVLIAPTEAVLVLGQTDAASPGSSPDWLAAGQSGTVQALSVRFTLQGANPHATVAGLQELSGKANYYIGNNRADWRAGVPLYPKVQIDQVYPGIRLLYYANAAARLEYDFVLQPGARPDQIGLRIDGVDTLALNAAGELVLKIGGEEIRQHKPVLYQIVQGQRKRIPGGYRLRGEAEAGFWVGDYDRRLPLVIDPSLSLSQFIGGKKHDRGWGVTVDGSGAVWIAGETLSRDLTATAGALQTDFQGGHSIFGDGLVAKFDQGTNLSYLTYFGGKGQDAAFGIAVGTNGEAFITGYTDSEDFPITNAFQSRLGGTNLNARRVFIIDAFVTKLNPNGTLAYSTYLGGMNRDVGLGIAVDALNRAYVTGFTESRDFPVVNPLQGPYLRNGTNYDGGAYHGKGDAFASRLSPDGAALEYSTFLGGTNHDMGQSIAVDSTDCAYVVGVTASTNFPVTNAFAPLANYLNQQTKNSFNSDAFISALSSNGDTLVYSAYVGGNHNDAGLAVAVDPLRNAYVTGYTYSTNFPVAGNTFTAWPSRTNSNSDAFVIRFDSSGRTNGGYSVVFGGKSNEQGTGIAVDGSQNAYVVGATTSRTNFADLANSAVLPPGFSATNSSPKSSKTEDAFVVELDPAGQSLFAAYLGGPGNDQAAGIAFDTNANAAYVVGFTSSTNFPGTAPHTYHGKKSQSETFLSRIQFP